MDIRHPVNQIAAGPVSHFPQRTAGTGTNNHAVGQTRTTGDGSHEVIFIMPVNGTNCCWLLVTQSRGFEETTARQFENLVAAGRFRIDINLQFFAKH